MHITLATSTELFKTSRPLKVLRSSFLHNFIPPILRWDLMRGRTIWSSSSLTLYSRIPSCSVPSTLIFKQSLFWMLNWRIRFATSWGILQNLHWVRRQGPMFLDPLGQCWGWWSWPWFVAWWVLSLFMRWCGGSLCFWWIWSFWSYPARSNCKYILETSRFPQLSSKAILKLRNHQRNHQSNLKQITCLSASPKIGPRMPFLPVEALS